MPEIKEPESFVASHESQEEADEESIPEENNEDDVSSDIFQSSGGIPENRQVTAPSRHDDLKEEQPFTVLSAISKLLVIRSMMFFVLLMAVLNIHYSEQVYFLGSVGLVLCAVGGNILLIRFTTVSAVLKRYVVVSSAIVDIGILCAAVFFNEASSAHLFFLFPFLTILYGFLCNTVQLSAIAVTSVLVHMLAYSAFDYRVIISANYLSAAIVHCISFAWIICFQKMIWLIRKNTFLKYHIFEVLTHILDNLPASVAKKVSCLLQLQKIDSLEYEFRKKFNELADIINEKTVEIEKLKTRMESGAGRDDEFEQGVSNAVMEINNLMEIENMTLRDENEKLSEMMKGYEDRIESLNQELETLNHELERTYRDKEKKDGASAQKEQTEKVFDSVAS